MSKLILPIKKKWFDMIISGEKTEEYREIFPYWVSRLCDKLPLSVITGGDLTGGHDGRQYKLRKFDTVEFRNGYRKDSRRATFEVLSLTIEKPEYCHPEWGADMLHHNFVLKLGKRLESDNES